MALVLVFGAAALAGDTVGPDRSGESRAETGSDDGGHTEATTPAATPVARRLPLRFGVSRSRTTASRSQLDSPVLERGRPGELRFSIRGADGRAVARLRRRAHEAHAPDRRPPRPTGFQHLHPTLDARRHLERPAHPARRRLLPRLRRLLARRRGAHARHRPARRRRRPAPRRSPRPRSPPARGDGYDVRLDAGDGAPGARPSLRFTVTRDGEPSRPSPTSAPAATWSRCARATSPSCTCTRDARAARSASAEFPTAGRYRLFLQFKHDGRVHTVAFTQEVAR